MPSSRMRKKYVLVLRHVFRHTEAQGWTAANPAERLKTPKPPRKSKNHALRRDEYLTPEEVHTVVRAAETADDGAFFLTLAFAGLRLGDDRAALAGRRLRPFRLAHRPQLGEGRRRPAEGRGRPQRADGRRARTDAVAARAAARAHTPMDRVFIGKRGGYIDGNRLRHRFYEAQARAGIAPSRTLHQLRHTFATVCASHGIPLRTIQGWCGHEDYATTERYAHFMPRHEDAALVSAAFSAPQRRRASA